MLTLYLLPHLYTVMHFARQNLAPFEKCARDFPSAPTDIYPKVRAIYQGEIGNPILTTIGRVTSLQSNFIPCFAPDSFP